MASSENRIQQPAFLSHTWNLPSFSSQFIQWKESSHLILSVWNHNDCLSSSFSSCLSLLGKEGTSKRQCPLSWGNNDRQLLQVVHPGYQCPVTSMSICVPDFYKSWVLGEVVDLNEKRPMTKTSNDLITKDSAIKILPTLRLFTAYVFWLSLQSSEPENGEGICTWEESRPFRSFQ